MNWILLLILLAAIVLFVKASNRGQNVWSYFVVAGAILTLISVLYVGTSANVSLKTLDGFVEFGKLYFIWLGKIVGNFAHVTGNAVRLDWAIEGTTNSTTPQTLFKTYASLLHLS